MKVRGFLKRPFPSRFSFFFMYAGQPGDIAGRLAAMGLKARDSHPYYSDTPPLAQPSRISYQRLLFSS